MPAGDIVGKPGLDLGHREARPAPDVHLAEARLDDDRTAQPGRDDLGRLARAAEIAGIDRGDLLACEFLGERTRLLAAPLVERRVGLALPTAVPVPIGLAVANEDQRGHAD